MFFIYSKINLPSTDLISAASKGPWWRVGREFRWDMLQRDSFHISYGSAIISMLLWKSKITRRVYLYRHVNQFVLLVIFNNGIYCNNTAQ